MSTLIIDDKAVAELETKYDSEMRFRPMVNVALKTVTFLLIALSIFHYYTAGFGVELRHNDVFRQRLREAAKSHRHQFLDQAGNFFADAERLLLRQGYAGLVVIFDSLEKIGDLPELQEPARRMFLGEHEALRLPAVNVLYTVPVRLVFSSAGPVLGQLYDGEPQVLPMVKVRDRATGAPVEPGHQALRQLLARRVDFDEVFGGNETLVARLVDQSGGYIRDLLRLTQYSLQGAGSLPVREEHVSQAIAKLRRSYVRAYSTSYDDLLRYIHEHRPELVRASMSTHIADVMAKHLTMVYADDNVWYDVHPLIRDLVIRSEVDARTVGAASSRSRAWEPQLPTTT